MHYSSISAARQHPDFQSVREQILKMGVDDPFFDIEGFWGGYLLQQNSYEFASFVIGMRELFPKGMGTYIEIGSAAGGMLRAVFELIGFSRALSIDNGAWKADCFQANADAIHAPLDRLVVDSHSKECEEYLAKYVREHGCDFLFIDGDHSYEGVMQDIHMVRRCLPKGSLIGFHDIDCERTPGVQRAFKESDGVLFEDKGTYLILGPNRMGIAICATK